MQFEVGGHTYRAGKLDAFRQFHVSRRIAPIIPTLIPIFLTVMRDKSVTSNGDALAALLQPFADGLASMSDETSEYVIATCLSVVQRKTGEKTWANVWNMGASVSMFDDIDLGTIMQIVIKVVADSLGPFIQGLLTSQMESAATTSASNG